MLRNMIRSTAKVKVTATINGVLSVIFTKLSFILSSLHIIGLLISLTK